MADLIPMAAFVTSSSAVALVAWPRRPSSVHRSRFGALATRDATGVRTRDGWGAAPAWLVQGLEELHLAVPPAVAWTVIRCTAGAAVAAALAWSGPLAAMLLGGAMAGAPFGVRRGIRARRSARREAQLPIALERLAAAVRSGQALSQALTSTAHSTPDPLGRELRAVAAEVVHGAGLAAALERWGNRPAAGPQTQLAATSLRVAASAGGEVARSIDRVAATLRTRREVQAEARALATQARASATVLGVAPLAFTGAVATVEPSALSFLLTSSTGLACLASGLALEGVGALWMTRILRSAR